MNMQTTTNYFCLSYKSFFVCLHFGLQCVDSQPQTSLIHLTQGMESPRVCDLVPSCALYFPLVLQSRVGLDSDHCSLILMQSQ